MQKIIFLLLACLFLLHPAAHAGEGMWIPTLLKALNEDDMQTMGMRMSAEDIYSVNNSSLKDAIVIFGGGCTGEIISDQGLLLTNHHCGYGQIQRHSSVENNYLEDGFWAKDRSEEFKNPGLSVTFIVRIEDVTKQVLEGITDQTDEADRYYKIQSRIGAITEKAVKGTHYDAIIKPFYYGNEYYMIVTERFTDVRLVGAPPSSIGKFGGDTDNWVWPRHNADFSMFRVYAGPDNQPSDISDDNVPLKPRHSLPVSIRDKQENDFTLVYGFPGSTQEYLPSYAVDLIMNQEDPTRIKLRDLRLSVMDREMKKSEKVSIQYASKQSGISNGYKKWKGEILGLKKTQALEKKHAYEAEFMKRVKGNPEWSNKYGRILEVYKELYDQLAPVQFERLYVTEGGLGIEAVAKANSLSGLVDLMEGDVDEEQLENGINRHRRSLDGFFKNYHAPIDQEVMGLILQNYMNDIPEAQWPAIFSKIKTKYKGDTKAYAEAVFKKSFIVDEEKFRALMANPSVKKIVKDPIYQLAESVISRYRDEVSEQYQILQAQLNQVHRVYMAAQREVFDEKTFYPDANFTLRVTYGQIEGYSPDDGVDYRHYTTMKGIMDKNLTGAYDYKIPEKLRELYKEGDYGRYGQEGELWVCFVASNHTSGGNSGSPVIDGDGRLIGLNFDRCWDGTMSDINYDRSLCRNISVDIRYILFLIDKYADAGYLLDEMELVE